MKIEEKVDLTEIWEVSGNGEFRTAKKLIAILANGYPLYVCEDFMAQITKRTETEVKQLEKKITPPINQPKQ